MKNHTKRRSWTNQQLIEAVKNSTSYRQVIKKVGLIPAGGNYAQIKKYIGEYKLEIGHFKGKAWNKGLTGIGKPIIPLHEILVKNSSYQSFKLKKRLFTDRLKLEHCEECGWAERTKDGYLPLELDHINGNRHDNRLNNQEFFVQIVTVLNQLIADVIEEKMPGWRNW